MQHGADTDKLYASTSEGLQTAATEARVQCQVVPLLLEQTVISTHMFIFAHRIHIVNVVSNLAI